MAATTTAATLILRMVAQAHGEANPYAHSVVARAHGRTNPCVTENGGCRRAKMRPRVCSTTAAGASCMTTSWYGSTAMSGLPAQSLAQMLLLPSSTTTRCCNLVSGTGIRCMSTATTTTEYTSLLGALGCNWWSCQLLAILICTSRLTSLSPLVTRTAMLRRGRPLTSSASHETRPASVES